MKEKYAQHQASSSSSHWHEDRKVIFKEAVDEWNNMNSPTSQQRKRQLSEPAKQLNLEANQSRAARLAVSKDIKMNKKIDDKRISELQLEVVNAALENGNICPSDQCQSAPSLLKPLELVEYTTSRELTCQQHHSQASGPSGLHVVSSMETVDNARLPYAISENMMAFLTERKSFVKLSHSQFHEEHSSICAKLTDALAVDESLSIEGILSCEQCVGRFCRKSIGCPMKFNDLIGMLRNIVRIVKTQRSIRQGNQYFLGMDAPFPVMLFRRGSQAFGWLTTRFFFKPLEVDCIECNLEYSDDYAFEESITSGYIRLRPKFVSATSGSNMLLPSIYTMEELALWFSQQAGDDWVCELFLHYDLDAQRPVSLILREGHLFSSSRIRAISFEQFAQKKASPDVPKKSDDLEGMSGVGKLMKRFSTQSNPKPEVKPDKKNPTTKRAADMSVFFLETLADSTTPVAKSSLVHL